MAPDCRRRDFTPSDANETPVAWSTRSCPSRLGRILVQGAGEILILVDVEHGLYGIQAITEAGRVALRRGRVLRQHALKGLVDRRNIRRMLELARP
jgi:hypothetical protein